MVLVPTVAEHRYVSWYVRESLTAYFQKTCRRLLVLVVLVTVMSEYLPVREYTTLCGTEILFNIVFLQCTLSVSNVLMQ